MNAVTVVMAFLFYTMKYQVGDTVADSAFSEEGVVTDIINKQMLMVDVKGEFSCVHGPGGFSLLQALYRKKIQPC